MGTWRRVGTTLGGGATALLLAGCGGGGFADESAETIAKETEKDMKALSAVTMTGDLTNDGQKLGLDMGLSTSGDCQGSIKIDGGTAEILSIDGTSWMKGDTAFWEKTAGADAVTVQQVIGDKWVLLPADQGGFADLCDLDSLLKEMGSDEDNKDKGEVKGTEDIDGQEAVKLDTETDEGDPLTVWVAVDDPHYILQMEVTAGKEPGQISFSAFDEKLDLQPPADDEVVDLTKLGG